MTNASYAYELKFELHKYFKFKLRKCYACNYVV